MEQLMWLILLKALLFVNICFADNNSVTSDPLTVSASLRRSELNTFPLKVKTERGHNTFILIYDLAAKKFRDVEIKLIVSSPKEQSYKFTQIVNHFTCIGINDPSHTKPITFNSDIELRDGNDPSSSGNELKPKTISWKKNIDTTSPYKSISIVPVTFKFNKIILPKNYEHSCLGRVTLVISPDL